jgi:hypothetical protein
LSMGFAFLCWAAETTIWGSFFSSQWRCIVP